MGCWASKKANQLAVIEEPKLDVTTVYEDAKQLSQSRSGSHQTVAAHPVTPPRPPSRTASAAGLELRPEQQIPWKMHLEGVSSIETFREIELIKDAACLDLGARKSKVGLCGPETYWLENARGGFSPATPIKGSTAEETYNAFQASDDKAPTVQVFPDLRLVPGLKDLPSVTQRPHLVFVANAMMVTRTGAGRGHALGFFSLWDTVTVPHFTPEREARLAEAAATTRAALQRPLLELLGLDPADAATSPNAPELPAVWVDVNDPDWRVLGINPAWEMLTGVGLDVLEGFPGLWTVLVASDGTEVERMRQIEAAAMTALPPGASLPLILSPCAPAAGTLQYIMAVRRPDGPPPLPASGFDRSPAAADVWMVECHVFVWAEYYRGTSPSKVASEPVMSGSSHDGSGGLEQAFMSTPVTHRVPTPAGLVTAPSIPPRFASLRLGHLLGSGSYANVYAGYLGGRPVAVKIITHSYGPDARTDDWLAHYEAVSNIDISHDNVVATLDWARLEDVGGWSVWIVQELAEKGSLSAAIAHGVLREGGVSAAPADMRAILSTAREIARGMRYLHSVNEIHSDLSSNNVMLVTADNARGFVAKVSDFGLTHPGSRGTALTQTVGTVTHMAPELIAEGKTSKASDVFSFGVILWELWTGKLAWAGMGPHQVIFAVSCRDEHLEMPPDAPGAYAKLATECMAPDRNDRPSFNEIVPRIDALLTALGPLPLPSPVRLSSKGHPVGSDE